MSHEKKGRVFLIGAGPGDPGLLSIKAKQCLERADVVIYDYLANEVFLNYTRKEADKIYVGKKGGSHTMAQEDINNLIIQKAAQGSNVVRLKGGDPFIFGRGGEEAQELRSADIQFEIVPGITSAIAVPAYAGIPLTHRDYNATVTFITGHEDPKKEQSNIDWEKISTVSDTLVFLMGVGNLEKIAENLVHYGRPPNTPVAVIHRGTVAAQKTVTGDLESIAENVRKEALKAPAIIVVGDVVKLREELNWFEKRPLFGKRILITRAREQASGFKAQLNELGAECIEFPTIEIVPPASWRPLEKAIESLDSYNWLLFTSVNGVKFFFEKLEESNRDVRELKGIKVGAIGPKTAQAVRERGIIPDLIPDEYRAESVIESFKGYKIKDLRILLPRAALAREVLPEELRRLGAQIDVIEAYRTIKPDSDRDKVKDMFKKGDVHMVTFTSSSTVTNFLDMFDKKDVVSGKLMADTPVACIGPITARTAEENGLKVSVTPEEYTIEALTDSIVQYFAT